VKFIHRTRVMCMVCQSGKVWANVLIRSYFLQASDKQNSALKIKVDN